MYLVVKTEAFILKVHLKVLMCEFLVPPNAFSFTNHCPFLAPIPPSPLSPYPFFSVHSPHSFPGAWTAQQQHWRTLAMRRYLTQTDAHTWHRGARTYRQLPTLTHSRTECHTHVAPPSSLSFSLSPHSMYLLFWRRMTALSDSIYGLSCSGAPILVPSSLSSQHPSQ